MPYAILGLHGWAGSGKTTTKNAVQRFIDNKFVGSEYTQRPYVQCYSFADPLKKICAAMFGDSSNWYGTQAQKDEVIPGIDDMFPKIRTYRDAMKFIGTEVFREHVDNNIWVKLMDIRICQYLETIRKVNSDKSVFFIIDDVRFSNEAEFIRNDRSGSVIRILKTGQTSIDSHASEQPLHDSYLTKTLEFKTPEDIEISAGYIYSIATGAAR